MNGKSRRLRWQDDGRYAAHNGYEQLDVFLDDEKVGDVFWRYGAKGERVWHWRVLRSIVKQRPPVSAPFTTADAAMRHVEKLLRDAGVKFHV